jgi:iron complex outermembrane recepter protein
MGKIHVNGFRAQLSCGVAALTLLGSHAYAQDATPEAVPQEEAEEARIEQKVVVTASRVAREGYTAPTPLTTISRETLDAQAADVISDILYEIPSVRPSPNNTSTSQASGNYVNLRGLGATRTLTLVDGRRFVPSNGAENTGGSSVDVNLIPEALVDRIEIVTGGASAAWGSDAVGGVVNLILKDSFEGIEGKVQYGVSEEGDAETYTLSLATGTSFDNDRGQLMIAAEYNRSYNMPRTEDREWGQQQCGFFPRVVDGTFFLGVQTCGLTHNGYTDGGVIVSSSGNPLASSDPLYGLQFLSSTSASPFDYGQINPINRGVSIGGDGTWKGGDGLLAAPLTRKTVFGRMVYDFSADLTGFVEASYGESGTKTDLFKNSIPSSTDYPIEIFSGNPYIPADVQAIMTANSIDSFFLSRMTPELGWAKTNSVNRVGRFAAGLDGNIDDNWSWDAYVTWGKDRYETTYGNNIIVSNVAAATDVVINPLTGQPDCRINVEGPAQPGELAYGAMAFCMPANPFGPGSLASAAGYLAGNLEQNSNYTQLAGGASIKGDAFTNWAGPVSVVAGVDYREEEVRQEVSQYAEFLNPPRFASGGYQQSNPKGFEGSYEVSEAFGEIVFPLLTDVEFAKNLDLNGAVRATHYSTSGSVTTWKYGATYVPFDGLLFRAARSKDIRAASLFENFGANTTYGNVTTRGPGGVATGNADVVSPGQNNPDLDPESATTTTFGVTVQDLLIPRLSFSIDAYQIELEDVIGKLGPQGIIDSCFGGGTAAGQPPNTALCALINASQTVVVDPFLNLGSIKTEGVEFDLSYTLPAETLLGSLNGDFNVRLLANYVSSLENNSSGLNPRETAGDQGGVPYWRWNGTLSYNTDRLGVGLQGEYIGELDRYRYASATTFADPVIPEIFYLDAYLKYDLVSTEDRTVQLFANVDNLLNEDPPFVQLSGATGWFGLPPRVAQFSSYNFAPWYDKIGRSYTVGARFSF